MALHNDKLLDDDVVNRVVLYVDDLDRCQPAVVVKVLEAVHLLLSYPLFVVVVAVDAHWVSKSLATVYPTLLAGGGVTPDNYLEKIFQLRSGSIRPHPRRPPRWRWRCWPAAERRRGSDGVQADDPGAGNRGGSRRRRPAGAGAQPPDPARCRRGRGPRAHAAASVVVEPDERTAIGKLAPLLGRSPARSSATSTPIAC